jgi:hypothetical protein
MKKISLCLLCLGLLTFLQAQQRSPSVLAPGGASAKGAFITLDWTLGELAVRSLSTPGGMLTEGFHQPTLQVEETTTRPAKELGGQLRLTVAPNPVHSMLSIRIESELEGRTVIDLWDLQGRRLQTVTARLSGEDLEWDMSSLPAAVYSLSFRTEEGGLLRTFMVTKVD